MMISIMETAKTVPAVGEIFHERFIEAFHRALDSVYRPGVAAGAFRDVPIRWVQDLVFSPLMNISLSRQMFAAHPETLARWHHPGSRDDFVVMLLAMLLTDPPPAPSSQ